MKRLIRQHGVDYPFALVCDHLKEADIMFCNLENPLTNRSIPTPAKKPERVRAKKEWLFRADPAAAKGLKNAGIDIVSLANNHTMDYSAEGLRDTFKALRAVGIRWTGAGMNLQEARSPVVLNAGGKRVAFLGFVGSRAVPSPHLLTATATAPGLSMLWQKSPSALADGATQEIQSCVQAARRVGDVVVVSVHWGIEKKSTPNVLQQTVGHLLIDSGADIVLGHHPHVLQGIEIYRGRLIAYSLGNFVFNSASREARETVLMTLAFRGDSLQSVSLLPVEITNARPRPAPRAVAQRIGTRVTRLSGGLGKKFRTGPSGELILTAPRGA